MKKSILLLMLFSPILACAGIIIPKNGENIEDVSNISIQGELVMYTQGGESKSLPAEEVSAVLYDNGNYEEVHYTPIFVTQQEPNNLVLDNSDTTGNDQQPMENKPVIENAPAPVENLITLNRLSTNRYTYGETEMDTKAMEQFLQNNCPDAYNRYMSGIKFKKIGWGVMGAGLALTIGGGIMEGVGIYSAGAALLGLGTPAMIVPIPFLCIGYFRTTHAHEFFNQQCATQEMLTINLQASQNGVGLALNF